MCLSPKQKCQCISPNITQIKATHHVMPLVSKRQNIRFPDCCPVASSASLCHSRSQSCARFPGALFVKSFHLWQRDSAAILRQLFLFVHNLPPFIANQYLLIRLLKCFFTLIRLYLPFLLLTPWLLWIKKRKLLHFCWKYARLLLRVRLSFCLITTV